MNIFHVTTHLNYSGANAELSAVALDQVNQGHQVRVCCVGSRGPWASRLESAGVAVDALSWTRSFDATPAWRLRDALHQASVEAVQVWGVSTLRWVGLLAPSLLSRVILCPPFEQDRSPVDRLLLGRVGRVVVRDAVERERLLARGVRETSIDCIAPGVAEQSPCRKERASGVKILGVGPIEKHKNFRAAVWTMDILTQAYPGVSMSLVGAGSERDSLREYSEHFPQAEVAMPGPCEDLSDPLNEADIVWAPGTDGCRHAVLEAMAAGRPVIASDLPHLRDVIRDGDTGFLITAGDKIGLARKTRFLLLDSDLRERMGEAARRHVRDRYSLAAFVEQWRDIVRAA